MDWMIVLAFISQMVRISVPYTLAAIGGTFSERGGVVNIALEGILLNGAFTCVLATHYTGNPWVGVLAAVAGGVATASVHAVVSITFKAEQIVSGLAINLLAMGATRFFLRIIFGSSSNSERIAGLPEWDVPVLGDIPVLSTIFSSPLILATIVIIFASQFVLFKTSFGLRLRSVGEHPEAADSLGVNVSRVRYAGVLLSGALAGLGGAWLAMDQHSFTDGMSSGRGYIALAAMIVGKWNPLGAAGACLMFGAAESLQMQLQGQDVPTQFIQMIPYVATVVVLAGFIGRSIPPAADGVPYEKERQ
ncbi:MAG: ABC transporter permease [Candidatus Eiseniibacteriota bacterium]|nr:MAG: ABC transporter permease [Candidatus Eisenbacteria bacterium]